VSTRSGRRLRRMITSTAGAVAGWALATQAAAQPAPAERANILLIIMDDVGVDTTSDMYPGLIDRLAGRYGPNGRNHPQHERIVGRPASTPVLEAFASESMVFTEAWAQPFCSPTRASILTGLYASRTGVLDYTGWLDQRHHSPARDFQRAGYATAAFGKWHMAGLNRYPGMKPKEAGFDLFLGNLNGAIQGYWGYDYQIQDETMPATEWRTEAAPTRSLSGIAPTTFAPVVKGADAIQWITEREREDPERPWFAWFAFNMSHITAGQFPNRTVVPNADTLDARTRAEMAGCEGEFGTPRIGECSAEALNRAMTNSMDTVIGKLLEAVERLAPNTYVIIIGDNGTPMYGRPGTDFIDNMYITRPSQGHRLRERRARPAGDQGARHQAGHQRCPDARRRPLPDAARARRPRGARDGAVARRHAARSGRTFPRAGAVRGRKASQGRRPGLRRSRNPDPARWQRAVGERAQCPVQGALQEKSGPLLRVLRSRGRPARGVPPRPADGLQRQWPHAAGAKQPSFELLLPETSVGSGFDAWRLRRPDEPA
jgi:arylsulfatase A-like enzyme